MHFKLMPFQKTLNITGFYTAFCAKYDKSYFFTGERHNFWELVYVLDGRASVIAEKTGILLNKGDIIFHKPMEFHALGGDRERDFKILIISFECQSPAMDFFCGKIFHLDTYQKTLIEIFQSELTFDFKDTAQCGSYQIGINLAEQLLLDLIRKNQTYRINRQNSDAAKQNIEKTLVLSIKRFLEENILETLSLSDVCKKFNMSSSYLCHLFKAEKGKSIMDYYSHLKIEHAKKLLQEDIYNISEISEMLSYTSIHNFSRSFKHITGLSPSIYKKMQNNF